MENIASKRLITPEQCRGARGLLGWSQSELAEKASISKSTVANFESGRPLAPNNRLAIALVFEAAGVELLNPNGGGLGVRFRDPNHRTTKTE